MRGGGGGGRKKGRGGGEGGGGGGGGGGYWPFDVRGEDDNDDGIFFKEAFELLI